MSISRRVYAGQGFDDLRAVAAQTLLESLMLQEEQIILGGNSGLALGTTPTPSLTAGIGRRARDAERSA